MSYICQHTGAIVGNYVPQYKVVTEWRDKVYENAKPIKKGRRIVGHESTRGREIVKELTVCAEAYKELTGLEPRKIIEKKKKESSIKKKRTRFVEPWRNSKNKKKNFKKNYQNKTQNKPIVEKVNPLSKSHKLTQTKK